jgi:hypothetical protein
VAIAFKSAIAAEGIRVTLVETGFLRGATPTPRRFWGTRADRLALRAIGTLIDDGPAISSDVDVFIPSTAAAELSVEAADRLGLPPLARLGLAVALENRVETPEGMLRLRWTDRSGQEIRPERTGIVLKWGEQAVRLSAPLFRIVQAAEGYNRTRGQAQPRHSSQPMVESGGGGSVQRSRLSDWPDQAGNDTSANRNSSGFSGGFVRRKAG